MIRLLLSRLSSRAQDVPVSPARRWVVVDVETSGLDAARDRLLAIAALAVHFDEDFRRPRIQFSDAFEVFIRQSDDASRVVDKSNILIHGIGVGAQRAGQEPQEALQAWMHYVGNSPLVAYHSVFDETMINRTASECLGKRLRNPWLDLEPLAAVAHEDPRRRSLDHWLDRYGIQCLLRHNAAADTLATAQLLLGLWPRVRKRVAGPFPTVQDFAAGHRFLVGRDR
jgi:DNA polymerase-3 subunit epsilon